MKKNGKTRCPLTRKNCSLSIDTVAALAVVTSTMRAHKPPRSRRLVISRTHLSRDFGVLADGTRNWYRTVRSLVVRLIPFLCQSTGDVPGQRRDAITLLVEALRVVLPFSLPPPRVDVRIHKRELRSERTSRRSRQELPWACGVFHKGHD